VRAVQCPLQSDQGSAQTDLPKGPEVLGQATPHAGNDAVCSGRCPGADTRSVVWKSGAANKVGESGTIFRAVHRANTHADQAQRGEDTQKAAQGQHRGVRS